MWLLSKDVYWPFVNHVSRDYVDPILGRIAGDDLRILALLQCGVFFVGVWLLLRTCLLDRIEKSKLELPVALAALAVVLCNICLMGLNPFLLSFHLAPLLMLLLIRRDRWPAWIVLPGIFFVTGHFVFSCGAQAISMLLLIWVISAIWRANIFSSDMRVTRVASLETIIVLAWLGVAFIAMPKYQMPEYPADAKLAPISVLSTPMAVSRIGEWLVPSPTLYDRLRHVGRAHLVRFCLLAISCLGVIWCGFGGRQSGLKSILYNPLSFSVLVGLVIASEFILAPAYLAYCPWFSLRRLIPGLPLVVSCVVFLPMLLSSGVVIYLVERWEGDGRSGGRDVLALVSLNIVLLIALSLLRLGGVNHSYLGAELSATIFRGNVEVPLSEADIMRSPSAFVFESVGSWVGNSKEVAMRDINNLDNIDITKSTITASVQQDIVPLMIDGKLDTRWSTRRPARPGDTVIVDLMSARDVLVIDLALGKASSDFPRGLALSSSLDGHTFEQVSRQDDWQGEVGWTREGYPYFVGQQSVRIQLPRLVSARFLRIEQIGLSSPFDWAIAELKIYGPRSSGQVGSQNITILPHGDKE